MAGRATRQIALALACAVHSAGTPGAWEAIHDHEHYVAYADPATLKRQGDLVQMRDLVDLKFPRPSPYGRQYASSTANSEFDCVERRMRGLQFSLHADQMGNGKIIETVGESNRWLVATPGTLLGILWGYACNTLETPMASPFNLQFDWPVFSDD